MDDRAGAGEAFIRLMALHRYFLNADLLRDLFLKRIARPRNHGSADGGDIDDAALMSLWYATIYVVIEGWKSLELSSANLDHYLEDSRVDDLRVFRNQLFHYQSDYDNPKLLRFLGVDVSSAASVTEWISRVHAALGIAIEEEIGRLANLDRD